MQCFSRLCQEPVKRWTAMVQSESLKQFLSPIYALIDVLLDSSFTYSYNTLYFSFVAFITI